MKPLMLKLTRVFIDTPPHAPQFLKNHRSIQKTKVAEGCPPPPPVECRTPPKDHMDDRWYPKGTGRGRGVSFFLPNTYTIGPPSFRKRHDYRVYLFQNEDRKDVFDKGRRIALRWRPQVVVTVRAKTQRSRSDLLGKLLLDFGVPKLTVITSNGV